jgi:hypothetical protein
MAANTAPPPPDRADDPEVQLVVLAAQYLDGRWPHLGTITAAVQFAAARVAEHRQPPG